MIAYLLASLPTPRLTEPPTIEPATFVERCRGFVSEERWRDLVELFGRDAQDAGAARVDVHDAGAARPSHADRSPTDRQRDPVARAWHDLSAQIDDAVAVHRAANARRDPNPYLQRPSGHRVDVTAAVEAAFALPNPGARERALDELRWRLAGELALRELDGFAALFARAVQLRLAWRWARWEAEAGWAALEANLRQLEASHA